FIDKKLLALVKLTIMTELILIKTSESEKIKKFCQQEHINYEIYQEEIPAKQISESELEQAYREA
ncbi:4600_t:CDS:1, partial [Scutellospora calospora]